MRNITFQELRELEVINLCGGERLGYPCDIDIELEDCRITSIRIPAGKAFSLFEKKDEYVIPWCKIECIGEDAILVRLSKNELSSCLNSCLTHKRKKMLK